MSAAIHLAARGHHVTLMEGSDRLGGKAASFERDGFSFDTGPSLLTLPQVVDELWSAAGAVRSAELHLVRLDPQCRYFFPDGSKLDLSDVPAATLAAIGEFAPEDVLPFAAALGHARHIYETLGRPFLEQPLESLIAGARSFSSKPVEALRHGVFAGSLRDFAARSVKDERLRWIIERFATYAGGSPARTPGSYANILHVEMTLGAWYPMGGIRALVRGIAGLLDRVRVAVALKTPVKRISLRPNGGFHVFAGDHRLEFDVVIANADPTTVVGKLLDPAQTRGLQHLLRAELSLSGVVLLLGVRGYLEHLSHHNVVFPKNYPEEFVDLFDRRRHPQDPTVYVSVPTRTDRSGAPDEHEAVYCMTNAPALRPEDSEDGREEVVARIKSVLTRLIPDLASRTVFEHCVGPADLRDRCGAPGGSIYGLSPHSWYAPFHRPLQRVARLPGLYFAGGGTQPGGGIPLVIRSGQFAADLVTRDFARGRVGSLAA
jgi:phytoene desaturase